MPFVLPAARWVSCWADFATPGHNGPLYYLLLRPWLAVAGESEFALRFFSLVFGVLAVLLVYRLARRLFPGAALAHPPGDDPGGDLALPGLVQPGGQDVHAGGGAGAAVHGALRGGPGTRGRAPLAGVRVAVTSLAFYVHLIAALVVPVQVVCFWLFSRRVRAARWKPWLASLAALTLPYLPLLIWQLPLLLEPAQTGYSFVPLPDDARPRCWWTTAWAWCGGVLCGSLAFLLGLLLAALLFGRGAGVRPVPR